jgi:hypothetical protein
MTAHFLNTPLSCPPNRMPVFDRYGYPLTFLDTVQFNDRLGEVQGFTPVDPIVEQSLVIVEFQDGEVIRLFGNLLVRKFSPVGAEFGHMSVIRYTPYGSRTYNTATALSDYDYIAVSSEASGVLQRVGMNTLLGKTVDVTLYGHRDYVDAIERCDIAVLESLAVAFPLQPLPIFDTAKLRASISEKASNSWVKGKKKMTVEADYNMYIAKKSLFHALRILKFGTAIAQHGTIDMAVFSMTTLPHLYHLVMDIQGGWNEHDDVLRTTFNKYSTEFKAACPKIEGMYSKSKMVA